MLFRTHPRLWLRFMFAGTFRRASAVAVISTGARCRPLVITTGSHSRRLVISTGGRRPEGKNPAATEALAPGVGKLHGTQSRASSGRVSARSRSVRRARGHPPAADPLRSAPVEMTKFWCAAVEMTNLRAVVVEVTRLRCAGIELTIACRQTLSIRLPADANRTPCVPRVHLAQGSWRRSQWRITLTT